MTKKAIAFIEYSINVDCPHCGEDIDLVDVESNSGDHDISHLVFTNEWDKLEGWDIDCPHCKQSFQLEKLEY